MEFLPAIDLKEGNCVRLLQGDAAKKTVYSSDPVAVAEGFKADGARWLHMVDLDGAFSGVRHHTAVVRQVKSATNLRIELGGGIRTLEDAESCLTAGAERIVLGTAAWQKLADLSAGSGILTGTASLNAPLALEEGLTVSQSAPLEQTIVQGVLEEMLNVMLSGFVAGTVYESRASQTSRMEAAAFSGVIWVST